MGEFLTKLFSSDFMPHGHCFFWTSSVLWATVISDATIALAYYTIPLALIYLVRKRRDLQFNWMFSMFALFIFSCGTTHLMDVWTMWHGTYRLAALVKAVTAISSIVTAILLWPLLPVAIALPSSAELRNEIEERRKAEGDLRQAHHGLEEAVKERTNELQRSNEELSYQTQTMRRFNRFTVGRELEMIRLKEEVNDLLVERGESPRYIVPSRDTSLSQTQ